MTTFKPGKPADVTALGESPAWTNVEAIFEYCTPRFINMMKHARPWADADDVYTKEELREGGYVTAGGLIVSLPVGVTELRSYVYLNTGYVSHTPLADLAYLSDSLITLTWLGSATVVVSGAGVSAFSSSTNSATFAFDATVADATILLYVTPTNPADYPHTWKMIPSNHAADYAAGKMYRQDMIADMAVFKGLRFLEFAQVNSSPLVNWADRSLLTYEYYTGYIEGPDSTYHRVGAPIEAMVKLCEELDANGWFCFPYAATDAYVTAMATLIRDTMPAGKMVFFEDSNETWNSTFDQFQYFSDQSLALWGSVEINSYAAYQSTRKMLLADAVFSGRTNLRKVLATQTSTSATTVTRLVATEWLAQDPSGWVDPTSVHDYLAITGYIGASVLEDNAAAIMAALSTSQATAVDLICDTYLPVTRDETLGYVTNQAVLASAAGLKLCMYENNQHMNVITADATVMFSGGSPAAGVLDMIDAVYNDARLETAKVAVMDRFKSVQGTFSCYYMDYGQTTKYGGWWWKHHVGDITGPSTGLAAYVAANPRHFHY